MSFGILLVKLVVLGVATCASINGTSKANDTQATNRRSGRTYDSPQQFVSIPVGYYKPPEPTSASSESEDDSTPKYDVPTSFDDFRPSDRRTTSKYPAYYSTKVGSPPTGNWKGDWSNGDSSPSWTAPSPADMAMMMSMMKGMNGDQDDASGLSGILSKLTSDPAALLGALLLPAAILLAAAIPTLVPLLMNGSGGSIPTVTTTATGNNARRLADSPSFVGPIVDMIQNFGARGLSEHACLQRSFCQATKGSDSAADLRPVQKSIYKAFTFVDDYWLEALGVKQLMEAMGSGDCEKIQCDSSSTKKYDAKKQV